MFGKNEIVGKSYFKHLAADELLITSRFFTLQGEGPYRGYPAYFIRLAKCNLACSFCDTAFEQGDVCRFENLLAEADAVIADFFTQRNLPVPTWASEKPRKMVLVITGGEPSLQSNLAAFLHLAAPDFQQTQIESNGISVLSELPASTTLVVSPKCLEKDGIPERYLTPNPTMLARADCLKFVMSAKEHARFAAYSQIPDWAHAWARETGKPIFISPMNLYQRNPQRMREAEVAAQMLGIAERSDINEVVSFWEPELLDMPKNQRNHEYAAAYCMQHGYILNLQIHLYASLP